MERGTAMKMTAMGRRFQLGNLYDYRNDRILTDGQLHPCDSSPKINTPPTSKFIRPEFNNKFDHMGLNSHLQASVMAGLIDKFRGASNYINDPANPTQLTRTLIWRSKERKEHLDVHKLDGLRLLNNSEATHIVVGVTYGSEAYCVLSLEPMNASDDEETNTFLSKVTSKMENALADGQDFSEFRNQFTEQDELHTITNVKCRIYADGQSQTVRECGLFDAYKHFSKLVGQFQTGTGKAVPIHVSLCPLKSIQHSADEGNNFNFPKYHDVEDELLDRCGKLLSNLESIKVKVKISMKVNKSLGDKSWNQFEKDVEKFQQLFLTKLKKGVVMARNGDDSEVEKAVRIAENHPNFKPCQLEKWHRWKLAEIEMARKITETSGIPLMRDKKEMERKLVMESKKHSLVLSLPALDEGTKKILEGMTSYVDRYKTLSMATNDVEEPNDATPWHTIHDEQMRVMAKIRDLIHHVKRNKRLADDKAGFFVTLRDSGDQLGYFYSVYQSDQLIKDNLNALPCPPSGLKIHPESTNSYRLGWDCNKNLGFPSRFVVQHRPRGGESWTTVKTGENNQMVFDCREDSVLELRVATETCIGVSEFSDVIDTELKAEDANEAERIEDESPSTDVREFDNWSDYSNSYSEIVSLEAREGGVRYAEELVKKCKKSSTRNGMNLYAIPFRRSKILKSADGKTNVERCAFGQPSGGRMQTRTILMMGATGSGKTTLINAMINYIFNVKWEDNFRFQLIDEETATKSQWESQTSCIKVYDIHHVDGFRVPYSLTIVDTPGYGDTKGLDRDQEITEMVRQFFEVKGGIQELDVIGFVVPASLPRLTPTQTYIFDSVLSIFGNDVKENINFLLTFSDSQDPPVLSAIAEADLPCLKDPQTGYPLHHKFNNSGFFCSNHVSGNTLAVDRFNKFFWDMGMKNFEEFFKVLCTMNTKSLSLTVQVLEERKRLEATIDALQPLIQTGLAKMEEIRKTSQIINNCKSQIEAHQNVTFDVQVTRPRQVQIPNGVYVTNCNKCYVTCHFPCTIPNDEGKVKCRAMNFFIPESRRTCWNCPKKCHWSLHSNQTYKWEYITETRTTSSDAIKEKYEKELERKLSAEELIKMLEDNVKGIDKSVLERVETVSSCIQRLDEIALRPNPFSTPQYIDLIIEAEQQEKRSGYLERIESWKTLRKMAVITTRVRNKEPLMSTDPYSAANINTPDESDGQSETTIEHDDSSVVTSCPADDDAISIFNSPAPRSAIGSVFSSVFNLN